MLFPPQVGEQKFNFDTNEPELAQTSEGKGKVLQKRSGTSHSVKGPRATHADRLATEKGFLTMPPGLLIS